MLLYRTSIALLFLLTTSGAARAADVGEDARRVFDAYIGDRPNRAIVLAEETLARHPDSPYRDAVLYVLGQSFSAIHLYEKASDAFHRVLVEHEAGPFAPEALRALCRMFFELGEHTAVVSVDHDARRRLDDARVPAEARYLIGQSYYLLDKPEEAIPHLLAVPPNSPQHPYARFTLAQSEFRLGRADSALVRLESVLAGADTPALLRDRALRTRGMILYQEERYRESLDAFEALDPRSPLYTRSRFDVAIAAEALDDRERTRKALDQVIETSEDARLRAQARVAFGRLFNRGGDSGGSRTLFDKAIRELDLREGFLRRAVDVEDQFRKAFEELIAFADQSLTDQHRRRLGRDFVLLRDMLKQRGGGLYDHRPVPEGIRVHPETRLFFLLHGYLHEVPLLERMVDLTVEIRRVAEDLEATRREVARARRAFYADPPPSPNSVPADLRERLDTLTWVLFTRFDLVTRLFNELALYERVDRDTAATAKRRALETTLSGLRLTRTGRAALPRDHWIESLLDRARRSIESGEAPGSRSPVLRQSFLDELESDRQLFFDLAERLRLKDRQMNAALTGIPIRSRNLNVPVLTASLQWLDALHQLSSKWAHPGVPARDRPWVLAGQGDELEKFLEGARGELLAFEEQTFRVVRAIARELVEREARSHALVRAEAEKGIADALFQERDAR